MAGSHGAGTAGPGAGAAGESLCGPPWGATVSTGGCDASRRDRWLVHATDGARDGRNVQRANRTAACGARAACALSPLHRPLSSTCVTARAGGVLAGYLCQRAGPLGAAAGPVTPGAADICRCPG